MDPKRKQIRDWLQAELDRKGHGAKGKLATYLGIRADGITRMLNIDPNKETREVKAEELVKMGEFFGTVPPVIKSDLKPMTTPIGEVKVIGRVAANTWMDVSEMDFDYDDVETVPSVGGYPPSWQYGLIIEGNCLNKIAQHGEKLVCLNIIAAQLEPKPGDLVVVERKKYGGQMVERTAKRLRQSAHGYELWPESNDPAHQDPIVLYEPDADVQVNIIGKVLWIVREP